MPFVSRAQRSYMHIHHPDIAARFDAETPKGAKLPYHVGSGGKGPLHHLFGKRKGSKS